MAGDKTRAQSTAGHPHFPAPLLPTQAGLRMLWVATIAGMVAWAVAFPSWFGLVLLAWAGVALCVPRPSQFLIPTLPLLPLYTSAVLALNVIGAIPTETIPDTVGTGTRSAERAGGRSPPQLPSGHALQTQP